MINDSPKTFYKYNGIFTNLYDSAFKNANLIIPFKTFDNKLKTCPKEKFSNNNKNSSQILKKINNNGIIIKTTVANK